MAGPLRADPKSSLVGMERIKSFEIFSSLTVRKDVMAKVFRMLFPLIARGFDPSSSSFLLHSGVFPRPSGCANQRQRRSHALIGGTHACSRRLLGGQHACPIVDGSKGEKDVTPWCLDALVMECTFPNSSDASPLCFAE